MKDLLELIFAHHRQNAQEDPAESEGFMNIPNRLSKSYLKCGGLKKHIVIKIEDLKHINSIFKLAMWENDFKDIEAGRKAEGKDPNPEYIVVNTDEPYIDEIIDILKRNGHWD